MLVPPLAEGGVAKDDRQKKKNTWNKGGWSAERECRECTDSKAFARHAAEGSPSPPTPHTQTDAAKKKRKRRTDARM